MIGAERLVLFEAGGCRFGLRLEEVERVLPMLEVQPLPRAPRAVLGVINLHGEILPVLDLLRRLRRPTAAPRASDRLVIARSSRRRFALRVDAALGISEFEPSLTTAVDALLLGASGVSGVVATAEGVLLIHDSERFMSLNEERRLDQALARAGDAGAA